MEQRHLFRNDGLGRVSIRHDVQAARFGWCSAVGADLQGIFLPGGLQPVLSGLLVLAALKGLKLLLIPLPGLTLQTNTQCLIKTNCAICNWAQAMRTCLKLSPPFCMKYDNKQSRS